MVLPAEQEYTVQVPRAGWGARLLALVLLLISAGLLLYAWWAWQQL